MTSNFTNTRRLMRKRKQWRVRALAAAKNLATLPTGSEDRDREQAMTEVHKCLNKLRQWFRAPRAQVVILAVQRRAIHAWRESTNVDG